MNLYSCFIGNHCLQLSKKSIHQWIHVLQFLKFCMLYILVVSTPLMSSPIPKNSNSTTTDQDKYDDSNPELQSVAVTTLPSVETKEAIRNLPVEESYKPNYLQLCINQVQTERTAADGCTPFFVGNTMILQFESDVSASELQDYIDSHNLRIVRVFPLIGAIQVEVDLGPYFQSESKLTSQKAILTILLAASDDFESDYRIQNASPDLLLSNH